jgi:hypothetical protein
MKHPLLKTIAGAGLLLCGIINVQAAPQYRDEDPWHRSREAFYEEQSWKMHLFDRVREDLDHVQTLAFSGGDEDRIVRTKQVLGDLQSRLADGRYDRPELDDAIAALTRVVADNRLSSRDRDMLNDDLNRMRDYREHHEDWR